MRSPRRRAGRTAGSALLEALVALAVVAVALLLVVALLAHELRLSHRAAAQREALATLESALAAVRAGALPLSDGTWTAAHPPWIVLPPGRDAALWLEVAPTGVGDLWTVTARVRYTAEGRPETRALATRVWRPRGGR